MLKLTAIIHKNDHMIWHCTVQIVDDIKICFNCLQILLQQHKISGSMIANCGVLLQLVVKNIHFTIQMASELFTNKSPSPPSQKKKKKSCLNIGTIPCGPTKLFLDDLLMLRITKTNNCCTDKKQLQK